MFVRRGWDVAMLLVGGSLSVEVRSAWMLWLNRV